MKTRNKILIGVGIAALLVVGFYVIFPFYLAGPPLPLYHIENEDVNNHEVVVEIFDSDNKSIFKETLELDPKEETRYSRPFLLNFRWLKNCTLKVTVDDRATRMYETDVYPWKEFGITIGKDSIRGEIRVGISAIVV